jgi:hypothetical protein
MERDKLMKRVLLKIKINKMKKNYNVKKTKNKTKMSWP